MRQLVPETGEEVQTLDPHVAAVEGDSRADRTAWEGIIGTSRHSSRADLGVDLLAGADDTVEVGERVAQAEVEIPDEAVGDLNFAFGNDSEAGRMITANVGIDREETTEDRVGGSTWGRGDAGITLHVKSLVDAAQPHAGGPFEQPPSVTPVTLHAKLAEHVLVTCFEPIADINAGTGTKDQVIKVDGTPGLHDGARTDREVFIDIEVAETELEGQPAEFVGEEFTVEQPLGSPELGADRGSDVTGEEAWKTDEQGIGQAGVGIDERPGYDLVVGRDAVAIGIQLGNKACPTESPEGISPQPVTGLPTSTHQRIHVEVIDTEGGRGADVGDNAAGQGGAGRNQGQSSRHRPDEGDVGIEGGPAALAGETCATATEHLVQESRRPIRRVAEGTEPVSRGQRRQGSARSGRCDRHGCRRVRSGHRRGRLSLSQTGTGRQSRDRSE